MNRKIFFTTISLGTIGFTILNSFPMKYFSKKSIDPNNKIKVKINPLSVSRNKAGGKNV